MVVVCGIGHAIFKSKLGAIFGNLGFSSKFLDAWLGLTNSKEDIALEQ